MYKCITWNILAPMFDHSNLISWNTREAGIKNVLMRENPDLIFLQEVEFELYTIVLPDYDFVIHEKTKKKELVPLVTLLCGKKQNFVWRKENKILQVYVLNLKNFIVMKYFGFSTYI